MADETTATKTTLGDSLRGRVLTPGDEDYDDARSIWNAMVDRRPRAIARCVNAADVATAIRFARDHDLEIGVRCGGHSVIGHAVPEDGLMIDLTPMAAATVDPQQRRARVHGGALLGALDRAALPHGLATTAGNVSHTGVGGLTLGGGMGWLARQHGLSCDNVESYELVTAAGDIVRVTADDHPDLFWALRGGGGNFGVVTEFEFRLHPEAGQTLLGEYWFPLDAAGDALRAWRELGTVAPRQATLQAWVGDRDGHPMVNAGFVWVGDLEAGHRYATEFDALGTPAAKEITVRSYVDLQRMDDNVQGHTLRRYWKGHYLTALPDDAIEAFILRGTPTGSGEYLPNASLQVYGGAISDVPDAESAFSHRGAFVEFVASARWADPAEDDARLAASRTYGKAVEPFATGAYVNALTDEGHAGVRRAYPPEKLARLTAVKDAWDPDNVFHLNHNIPPSNTSP